MPEAQPRDTKLTVGIIPIWYFNNEHMLIARSEAEGIFVIYKCVNNALDVFCAQGAAEGYKTRRGYYSYLILQQWTHFDGPKRSWGQLTYK